MKARQEKMKHNHGAMKDRMKAQREDSRIMAKPPQRKVGT